jgi:hypothetical protein
MGQALRSVPTGEPAFNHVYGTDLFTYLDGHAEAPATFNDGMTGRAASADVAVAHACSLAGRQTHATCGGFAMMKRHGCIH